MAVHDFLMLEKPYDDKEDISQMLDRYYESNKRLYKTISIEDDIIIYLMDSFNLIKTIWVSKEVRNGLDYLGYSVISNKSLDKLNNILSSWIKILSEGEEEIILKGEFIFSNNYHEGEYEKLVFNKEELLKSLSELRDMCYTSYKENYYILHLGI